MRAKLSAQQPLFFNPCVPCNPWLKNFRVNFPYCIIYEVDAAAQTVFVIAVRHAARRDLV